MNRRTFLKITSASLVTIPLSQCASSTKRPPNVLFIVIDDLNDWIGCLGGHPDAKTSNFDRLARRGMLFTNAHCSAPRCNPSRTSVLTGLQPSTLGVYTNRQRFRQVLPDVVTLPQHFMAHGYRVVGGGKIFHAPDPESWHGYFPSEKKSRTKDDFVPINPCSFPDSASHTAFDWGAVDVTDDEMEDGKITNWAVDELGKTHDVPFFLGVGVYRPHQPWYVPRKYFEMYPLDQVTLPIVNADDLDDIPPIGVVHAKRRGFHTKITESGNWRKAISAYLASVSFADAMVGKILDALDASPYAENTIILLWSDHGFHLGEKLHWQKWSLWEETTRVPLILVAPGITRPGGRCSRPVSLCDIYPTLIDLCGLTLIERLDGKSVLPLLKNPDKAWKRPAITTSGPNNHSIRSERWRYIRYKDGTEELYDHQNDALEWINLAAEREYAAVKAKLAQWLPEIHTPHSRTQLKRGKRSKP